MITLRRAEARFHTRIDWLDSWHTFSFGEHYDPRHLGFRSLRVLNDDRIAPGGGFAMHGHRDMEIVTLVLEGELEHRDSTGEGSILCAGQVQRMSAGRGVRHSEKNASTTSPVHLLQIWIVPASLGLAPSYEQQSFPAAERRGRLRLVASPDGREGSVTLQQDAELYVAELGPGETAAHAFRAGRHGFVHLATGAAELEGKAITAGDGACVTDERAVEIATSSAAQLLVFDLA